MRVRILSCLFLLAVGFDAAASDLYTTINQLRAGAGNCAVMEDLPPLKPQATLERVARDLARGDELQQSLKAAGYRPVRSSALTASGPSRRAGGSTHWLLEKYWSWLGRST